MHHPVQWTAPAQVWGHAAISATLVARQAAFRQPAILRFATDSFMDDFMAMLERDPAQLERFIAQPETWRGPLASPEPIPQVPGLLRRIKRLGLAAARQKGGLSSPSGSGTSTAASGSTQAGDGAKGSLPFKLYQPAHQRYYLITACLVCAQAGLPDRAIDPALQERTTFVIRRLFPSQSIPLDKDLPPLDQTWDEYALVVTPTGTGWKKVAGDQAPDPDVLVAGEESLPLFSVCYTDDEGRRRRVLTGLIPVGKREAYMGPAQLMVKDNNPAQPGNLPKTSRKILFRKQVSEPWKRLIDRAYAVRSILNGAATASPAPNPEETYALMKETREQLQTASWYVLLDLAEYLQNYLPDVWEVVKGSKQESELTGSELQAKKTLLAALQNTTPDSGLAAELTQTGSPPQAHPFYTSGNIAQNLLDALKAADSWRAKLERATGSYDRTRADQAHSNQPDPAWPDVLFPLADAKFDGPQIPDAATPLSEGDGVDQEITITETTNPANKKWAQDNIDKLVALVVRALPTESAQPSPAMPLAAQPVMDTREGWFVIRCVFERPQCEPLETAIVSEPTRPFQMAGFFDPDAPARPIRIALPVDTTLAGLRKFDKNTAFMISDVLCGQINRMKGLTFGDLVLSVLPWPFHKSLSVPDGGPCKTDSGLQVGMICSLSIPIITICALILLMIIVSLLDIIFKWVPYLIACFPLPGFKAKKAES